MSNMSFGSLERYLSTLCTTFESQSTDPFNVISLQTAVNIAAPFIIKALLSCIRKWSHSSDSVVTLEKAGQCIAMENGLAGLSVDNDSTSLGCRRCERRQGILWGLRRGPSGWGAEGRRRPVSLGVLCGGPRQVALQGILGPLPFALRSNLAYLVCLVLNCCRL